VPITTLQVLDLDDDADHTLALNSPAWGMIADMTGLSKLSVRVWRHSLYEVLQLTALKQLTCLSVGVTSTNKSQDDDGEQTLSLFSHVRGTQQAGWCCAYGSARCFVTRACVQHDCGWALLRSYASPVCKASCGALVPGADTGHGY